LYIITIIPVRDNEKRAKEIENYLFDGEVIENTYGLLMDFACLTNKRVLFVEQNTAFQKESHCQHPLQQNRLHLY